MFVNRKPPSPLSYHKSPIGLDSMLMNYHTKKKGFAKLFSLSSQDSLSSFSHACLLFHKGANQKLATDQCQGRINVLKEMCALWSLAPLYENFKPFGYAGHRGACSFSLLLCEEQDGGKSEIQGA